MTSTTHPTRPASGSAVATTSWKLSPSDFSFLWEECKRCFYLKLTRGFRRPSTPMPSIFSKIAGMQKTYFDLKRTADVHPLLPPGVVAYGEKFVQSVPISFPEFATTCYIKGRFDNVVRFDDGTYGVIDFKTSTPQHANHANYGRQLHAYTYALEHPAPGALTLSPISKLGLLCLEPTALAANGPAFALACDPVWIEIQRDDETFMAFVREVLQVLDAPDPPPPSEGCVFCQYRDAARTTGH